MTGGCGKSSRAKSGCGIACTRKTCYIFSITKPALDGKREEAAHLDIDIRFADASALSDPARFLAAYAAVTAQRREKVDRLRAPEAKRLSLCAGLLLRQTLEAHGVASEAQRFSEGPHGKPFLPGRPDVCFSLSHSGTRVMCAAARSPVGCDLQLASPRDLRLARRFFTSAENEVIFSQPDEASRTAMFYRIWVLKESFLKCIGTGLALPLNAFSVFPEGDRIVLHQRFDDGHYSFLEPAADPDFRSACCIRTE